MSDKVSEKETRAALDGMNKAELRDLAASYNIVPKARAKNEEIIDQIVAASIKAEKSVAGDAPAEEEAETKAETVPEIATVEVVTPETRLDVITDPDHDEAIGADSAVGDVFHPRVKHVMRTVGVMTHPDGSQLSVQDTNATVLAYLQDGYSLKSFEAVGVVPGGHKILWVFEKDEDAYYYEEIHHVIRVVKAAAVPDGSVSGFQADALLDSYMSNGWELMAVKCNGVTEEGVFMVWMLGR